MMINQVSEINCVHFSKCSGCELTGNVKYPPVYEEMKAFFNQIDIPFEYETGIATHWRTRAKLAVRGSVDDPKIGLYEKNSHDVIEIPFCEVHHPLINKAIDLLKEWMIENKIQPYDESKQTGLIRYVQCVVERHSGRVQLSLVVNRDSPPFEIKSLFEKDSLLWHSIWFNFNTSKTNTIFGPNWILLKGENYLREKILENWFCFHPANFAQANLDMFEVLLKDLQADLTKNKTVLEYYAGVGVIGCCVANTARSVTCAEINPFAEISFKESIALQKSNNVHFVTGHAEKLIHLIKDHQIIIVDPPRKGLDKALLKEIQENNSLEELWYMSCGWNSFKKDCVELQKNLELKKVKGYLFFPGTNHVETLALFKKKSF